MSKIIADTYEIEGVLGAGGGGVVYLAEHLRLHKKVVLKADKRKISAKPEALRREVDAMKNLSHTYIPQVYDFLREGDTVYTVMDYVEGESFDRPLGRGERFSQAQVVEWACELLEALEYLHSRPPHGILHGDIKPANVMLTPQNEIRLIDFNIALALGEEGAVKVGYSRGYASPEHYSTAGLYRSGTESATETLSSETATMETSETAQKSMLLDVRSDIYSLGATLYHILTGRRPAADAREIIPIAKDEASPLVAAILTKAMAPDPAQRYQSAREMLDAFRGLFRNDPRAKRLRRMRAATAAALAVLFALGGCSAFTGLKRMERLQSAYALAEKSENALRQDDVTQAVRLALQAIPEETSIFTPPATAQAQKALADALGLYDLSDGYKNYGTIELPAEPVKLALAPDGRTAAALYTGKVAVFDTQTMQVQATLLAEPSALADVRFASQTVLLYAGQDGLTAYDTATGKELWRGGLATSIALSADGSAAAAVYKDENKATVYDCATGAIRAEVSFGERKQAVLANDGFADPEDSLLALSADGTMLAASFSDGALMVFDLRDRAMDLEIYDQSEYTHFEGGFFGKYFAFSSTNPAESVFAVVDTEQAVQTGGFASQSAFGVQADESGIYVCTQNLVVKIHPETGEQQEVAYTDGSILRYARGEAHTLAVSDDNTYSFFDTQANLLETRESETAYDFVQLAGGIALLGSLDSADIHILKLENHPEAQVFQYDPSYVHDEARLSADGQTVMLFRYDGFRLYGLQGELICETAIPDAGEVYDQQYRREGDDSYLEVLYNSGLVRTYSAADGRLLSEEMRQAPDGSLTEEFLTDRFRIVSPLHGVPEVYDRESGKRLGTLAQDAYLTYVTQVGEYIVTEYVTADGERYGLLCNADCEAIATLPNLCDIVQDELIFDYQGNLRKSRIYSIEELTASGQARLEAQQTAGKED